MIKMLKNKKGLTVVTVLIIMTVLVLLCAVLLEAVMSSIVLTKRHNNIDLAYYAGESAIENWAAVIDKQIVIGKDNIGDNYTGPSFSVKDKTSSEPYGRYIVGEINKSSLITQKIDIEDKNLYATVDFVDLEFVDTDWDTSCGDNMLYVLIGIKGKASYSSASAYTAGNKEVYAIKKFKVSCPVKSQLEGAIYTVGDFYINGNRKENAGTVKVKGDVFTFGSYGEEYSSSKQWYYGGIYATRHGNLKIYGNAYSRSFIRTGPYQNPYTKASDPNPDSSSIVIFKDAIAQCIQAFGHNSTIVTMRNAYTFDDVEINSEDSVIAINGSFFGLSCGGSNDNHDDSSAVVNSAMVHQELSDASKASRIAINGDLILGGTTWKINDSDEAIASIEDASLAYNNGGFPHYKSFDKWDKDDPLGYHKDLREKDDNHQITSKYNQFQVFNIVDPFSNTFDETNDIKNWINKIKADNYSDKLPPLRGYFQNEVAANNKLYRNIMAGEGEPSIPEFTSDFFVTMNNSSLNPIGSYVLDNIFDNTNNRLKYSGDFWKTTTTDFETELFDKFDPKGGKCGEVKTSLLGKVSKYVVRDYPTPISSDKNWQTSKTDEFDTTLNKLKALSGTSAYILLNDGNSANPIVKDLSELDPTFINIYETCKNSRSNGFALDKEYYLVVNTDPKLTITIDGEFNGMIVTAGKIVLKDKASVYGSLIAAGGGSYNDIDTDGDGIDDKTVFYPEAKAISNDTLRGDMDNGEYAAISTIEEDDDEDTAPYVDFFLGLAGDKNARFDKDAMKAVINEARNNPIRGNSLIPDSLKDPTTGVFDEDSNEYLAYLNRAARINLLQKLEDNGLNLFSIF